MSGRSGVAAPAGHEGSRGEAARLAVGVKRPRAVEIDLVREEMGRELVGLIGPFIIFGSQLFMPTRRAWFAPNLFCVFAILASQLLTLWVLKRVRGYDQLKAWHFLNDAFHHSARTSCHVCWIICDNNDMMSRLIFLFIAPCDAARMSRHTPFVCYMAVNIFLIMYRFGGDFFNEMPFIVTGVAVSQILYETSVMKQRGEDSAIEKSRSMVTLMVDVTQEVFSCFCDATARMSPGMDLLEEAKSLGTFLGRKADPGRSFADLVHASDREEYKEWIKSCEQQSSTSTDESEVGPARADLVRAVKLRSYRMHLEDSANIPVECHVFHACLEDVDEQQIYLLGVSETESFRYSQKKKRPEGGRSTTLQGQPSKRRDGTMLDMDSGKLVPARPTFDQSALKAMNDLQARTTARSSNSAAGPAEGRRAASAGATRAGSPRPESRCRLTNVDKRLPRQRSPHEHD